MPRPKPFVALYGQVDFDKMIPADDISGTDIFVCRQGADGDNVFATASQLNDFFGVPDPILLNDGSAAAPSYSFVSNPNTGTFLIAPDQFGISAGGVVVASFVEAAGLVQFVVPLQNNAAAPSIAFGDGDSGWFESADDIIDLAIGGVITVRVEASGIRAANGGTLLAELASATNPSMVPDNADRDTGIGHTAANQLSFIAGGVQVANLTEAAGVVQFIVPLQNNASFPSIAFGDGDTGFYEEADDTIGITSLGTKRFEFSGNNFSADAANGPRFSNANASATVPTLIPDKTDPNTGIGHNTTDQLSLIGGGLTCMSIKTTAGVRQIGFYEGSPISLQTGVAVTTAAVHDALVNLRLITA